LKWRVHVCPASARFLIVRMRFFNPREIAGIDMEVGGALGSVRGFVLSVRPAIVCSLDIAQI
jgi:hypothetical protein